MSMKNFETVGFVSVPYPNQFAKLVKKTEKSWEAFCLQPDNVKMALGYSNNSAGVGYEKKEGRGNKSDIKENFDITFEGTAGLEALMQTRTDYNPVVREFVDDALALTEAVGELVSSFTQRVEETFGLKGYAKEVSGKRDNVFLRFIHYPGGRIPGDFLAQPHVDQGGITFHLFESAPGLECLSYKGKWRPMPVSRVESVVIPDMQMQLRSSGRLRALWHRVVANKGTARSGRYSAVAFVHFPKSPKYDKDKHGRLQEMKEGFNYSITPEEFARFFK